jgi:ribonucleoside-diphosphate reductase alpha chain
MILGSRTADAFIMLRLPFTSDEAMNQEIFETLYFAAVTASMEMAKVEGTLTFEGSPISRRIPA